MLIQSRNIIIKSILLFFILTFAMHVQANPSPEILITAYKFVPEQITVTKGTKVVWANQDDVPHTIVETNKGFRSSALDTHDQYSFIFSKPGVYHYFCTLHPMMTGTITVTE